ncbi:MAG: carboxylesterase/lipase family protein [Sphingomonas sp.]|uniref:carboxylesterase/lipase family protein n=1 Tax=Sphingomonas sp. TaxID=28214 RepID=UPI00260B7B9C|nr:carboxylesterase/lipase family protein [Sphingomonas sp.]MDK2768116.1 carboxylesterase/lipase family protein [Sphingomonas sp.]
MFEKRLSWWASLLVALTANAPAHAQPVHRAPVHTPQGWLQGSSERGVERFLNIPFAAPPVDELRWRPPVEAARWTGVRDATAMGPACPQPVRSALVAGGVADHQSEDCLQLNIWRPAGGRHLPVMVWIHGGAHVLGSGTFPVFDGTALARQGVILVTINYRLGALGYFAHPALTAEAHRGELFGNFGLMDQLEALRWVQRNIGSFGGDPRKVTVFGESAGGISITTMLANPAAKGLFARAIVESSVPTLEPQTLEQQEAQGMETAERAGLGKGASAVELRALSIETLLKASAGRSGGMVGPFIDGRLIREAPWRVFARGEPVDVPLLIGSNSNEASVILAMGVPPAAARTYLGDDDDAVRLAYGVLPPAELARQALGDAWFVAPARWMAMRTQSGAPSWLYHFDYVAAGRRDKSSGAPHGSEIPYLFGTLDYFASLAGPIDVEDRQFGEAISTCWVAFAKTGKPGCKLVPKWPRYRSSEDTLALFSPASRLASGFRRAQIDLLLKVWQARTGGSRQ